MFLTDADTRYKFILIFNTEIQFFMTGQEEPEAIKVALPIFLYSLSITHLSYDLAICSLASRFKKYLKNSA
jgi:hypothetical protein